VIQRAGQPSYSQCAVQLTLLRGLIYLGLFLRTGELQDAEWGWALISGADTDNNHTVERHEFALLVYHMAAADLESRNQSSSVWPRPVG
jgi:hypothetical protein